jgi:hypothetical protein
MTLGRPGFWRRQTKQLVGPALLGITIVILPFRDFVLPGMVLLTPLLIWFELRRIRRSGVVRSSIVRTAVLVGVVLGGTFFPSDIWVMNQKIGPLPQVATLQDVRVEFKRAKLRYWYPEGMGTVQVVMPPGRISIRRALATIEAQTGLHHDSTSFCGTGAPLLMRGGPPDLIVARVVEGGEHS